MLLHSRTLEPLTCSTVPVPHTLFSFLSHYYYGRVEFECRVEEGSKFGIYRRGVAPDLGRLCTGNGARQLASRRWVPRGNSHMVRKGRSGDTTLNRVRAQLSGGIVPGINMLIIQLHRGIVLISRAANPCVTQGTV